MTPQISAPRPPTRLRSEAEILAGWNGSVNEPLVSIGCITYNHVKHIREAIHGFLCQETDFPFEVLIYDDASPDGTAEIVREYAAQYPRIIQAFCQSENQLSKGVKGGEIVLPKMRGRYIATCEGDDYWFDPRKLQVQADF